MSIRRAGRTIDSAVRGSQNYVMRRPLLLMCSLGLMAVLAMAQQPRESAPRNEDPETKPYKPPPAWKSTEIGNFYLRRKSYRAALSRFQEAAAIDPYYAQSYLGMGRVYEQLGLRQKALDNYRKYLDLLPSSKEAEEAKSVQKAVARLEARLNRSKGAESRTSSKP